MNTSTVKRSLYYYDLYALYEDEKTNSYKSSYKIIKDFFIELEIEQHTENDFSKFIKTTRNGDSFFVIVDKVDKAYTEFRIVLCRNDALPFIEKNGKLESLGDYIDANQSIAEITHCVYFFEYGIMGAEYNFSGSRPTAIADYLYQCETSAHIFTCRPKLNFDAYSKLIENEEYSLFDFAVKSDSDAYNKMLANKSIFKAIRSEIPDTDVIEIVLRKRKTKKNKFSGFLPPLTMDETKELIKNYRDDIKRFNVSQTAFSNSIDLLSDKFVHKATFIRTLERTINSDDMYREIRKFFNSTVVQYCKKLGG